MFSYHCTIAWQCGICDSLCCLFYLTVVFFFFLCCMCVCSFSLFDKSLLSGAATMLLMLLFLIFYSPLACYNIYRFVASSLFSCCPIIKSNQKSNLHYTRRITPKRVTSCGAHLRGSAPGQHSSEESSQRWRVVGDTVPI